ncbi:MAG: flagellar assembly protein FliW [Bacteroides sp.]|nr:flagellar assembly protein FliW [Prevotella sp.]MCM1407360.1 flagellar assembly protein FliW [Treponema brennaborense]MCM1469850.1 flagellar assembly protein FliW [Bacteroides sp.]
METKESEKKLTLPYGLFGFDSYTEFSLSESAYKPFLWLQSLQDTTLAFLTVDPFVFFPEYEIDVDDASLEKINIASAADVQVLVIITVPGGGKPITANLQGPLIVNKKNNKCMQVVLEDSRWQTKHRIESCSASDKGDASC